MNSKHKLILKLPYLDVKKPLLIGVVATSVVQIHISVVYHLLKAIYLYLKTLVNFLNHFFIFLVLIESLTAIAGKAECCDNL